MSHDIAEALGRRGIMRLCHFTPSRNLAHILAGRVGILATKHLQDDERAILNATDVARWDGFPNHICCSISYPNAWYFRKAQSEGNPIFPDWVVLLIRPDCLLNPGTLFCPVNAATGRGRYAEPGAAALDLMFADEVPNARAGRRGALHLQECPTDDQAEVLVPDRISVDDILGIAVSSKDQAALEFSRLRFIGGVDPESVPFVVAPAFYDPSALSRAIRAGRRPSEAQWHAHSLEQ